MIQFELVTLSGIKHHEMVHEALLPTPEGIIAVFEHHAPLVSITKSGIVSLRREANHPDDMLEHYAVSANGVIEIQNDTVRVLVDEADHSRDVDEKLAAAALAHAQQLAREAKDKQSLDQAMQAIDRHTVRLKLSELKRRTRR